MIDSLKKMHLKAVDLLNKYKESLEYEKCTHHIVEIFDSGGYGYGKTRILMLIDISTGKILKDGDLKKIKSYINLRNLDVKKIYEYDKIFKI
jgi:hypothetical protein